ncbi:MAG: alpha/beta hydrolase [Clostridiales bacterium]|nr:alpha/beta hydrolase [Clostridiales bacterium]
MKQKDLNSYRKYMEVEYGDVAPEVCIPTPQSMAELNDQVRAVYNLETVSELTQEIRRCAVYPQLTSISIDNTSFLREGYSVPVRVHYPEGKGPFPVVVLFHGGGFMMNNLDVYDSVHRYLARFGNAVVISVDYRLAPENKFPTGLEDCYVGLLWACENAAKYGGDISSLTVCGDSAGGNYAAVVSLLARDRKGPKIHKQVLIYPLVTFEMGRTESMRRYSKGYFLELDEDVHALAGYFNDPAKEMTSPYASPLLAESHKGLPPALFISAECDPILDQALIYAAKLQDEGVEIEFRLFKGMLHGFINRAYGKTFESLSVICDSLPPL